MERKTQKRRGPSAEHKELPANHEGDPLVAEVLNWYRANNPNHSRCKTAEKERQRILGMFGEEFGNCRCSEMRPHHLLDFINRRGRKSAWTRRRFNVVVQRPFNYACKLRFIVSNPMKGLTFPAGRQGRDWTDAEMGVILRNANPTLRRFIIFARYSGMRQGELRNLQWSDIDPERGLLVVEDHKTFHRTGQPRLIPINSIMLKMLLYLRRQPEALDCPFIFLNSFGDPWSLRGMNKAFWKIRIDTDLPDSVKLHGARHTFATSAIVRGVDIATLAQLLGHNTVKTTERYTHLTNRSDHLQKAMEKAATAPKPEPVLKDWGKAFKPFKN